VACIESIVGIIRYCLVLQIVVHLCSMKRIVILTGAGISAESGIKTFRDSDGLWNGYNVEEVASPEGFAKNPQLVLDFYNMRRADVLAAQPNAAHLALAQLQQHLEVIIITQNIDDLHERAGSNNIVHLHGQITLCRSVLNDNKTYPYNTDLQLGMQAPDGGQLRPHIVWFGEQVPLIDTAIALCSDCDYMAVIGTSLAVYPAAGLLNYAPPHLPVFIVDKHIPPIPLRKNYTLIEQAATTGVPIMMQQLLKLL
jgi:NAD-dependent deacetylase